MKPHQPLIALVTLLGLAALACTFNPSGAVQAPTRLPTSEPGATSHPEDATPSDNALSRYENSELGFSFDYPEGWALQDLSGFVTLASEESLLRDEAGYTPTGGLIIVAAAPFSDMGPESLEDALDTAISQLEAPADAEIRDGPTVASINGHEVVQAVISGTDESSGEPILFYVTVLRRGGFGAIVSGTTLAGNALAFEPQFNAIVSSLQLSSDTAQSQTLLPAPIGELTFGQTVTGTMPANQSVVWTFQGTQGDVVNVIARPTSTSLDLTLDVVDSAGQSIIPSGEIDASLGAEETGSLIVPSDGSYSIVLGGFLGSGGEYELTLEESSAAFGAIAPGAVITGSLDAGGFDTFTFGATEGLTLTLVAVPGPELDLILTVLDLDEESLVSQDVGFAGEGEVVLFAPEQDGQYRVQVREFSGEGSGPYTLGIMSDETALIVDDSEISGGNAVDYTLSLAGGQSLVAVATPLEEFDIVLALQDSEEQLLLQVDVGFDGAAEILAFTPQQEGEYILRISSSAETGGPFRLMVSAGLAGSDSTGLEGSGQTDRRELFPGSTLDATLAVGAQDSYVFTSFAGEENTFFVIPTSTIDPVVEITNAAGTLLLNVDNGFTGEAETLTFVPDEGGEYMIHVRNFIDGAGGYVIGLLDSDSALLDVSGAIGNNTADNYELSVPANEERIIILFPEDGFDAVVEILDQNGQVIASSDSGIASGSETFLFLSEVGGDFILRVSGFVNAGGSYRLVVLER